VVTWLGALLPGPSAAAARRRRRARRAPLPRTFLPLAYAPVALVYFGHAALAAMYGARFPPGTRRAWGAACATTLLLELAALQPARLLLRAALEAPPPLPPVLTGRVSSLFPY
jgi:hypothetical protein